jgi:hypothetical protein
MKMVEIKEKVKHDSKVFYPGERRMLEDEEAAYFCKHGWATADGLETGTPDKSEKVLDVKSGKHVNKGEIL